MPFWLLDRRVQAVFKGLDDLSPYLVPLALLLALGAALLDSRRKTLAILVGFLVLGAVLRLAFAPETLLGMSNYEREPSLIPWLVRHGLPFFALLPDGLDRFQVIARLNLALSFAWPLVTYALGRAVFRNERVALFAACLLAVCPQAVYYARSDVLIIASALLGAVTLLFLQRALDARYLVEEVFFGVAALALFPLALLARQESFLLGGAFVVPLVRVVRSDQPRRWFKPLWCVLLGGLSALQFWGIVQSKSGGHGAFLAQVAEVARQSSGGSLPHRIFVNNGYFLRPWAFPLAYLLLALGGVFALRRRGMLLAYLFCWLAIFALGHSTVPAWDLTASARYALHSIVPLLFLASFGLEALVEWWRGRGPDATPLHPALLAAGAALLVGTTVWSLGLFRLPESDVQQEYRFLRGLDARGIPERGALVVERYGDRNRNLMEGTFFAVRGRPRFEYFGQRVRGEERAQEVVSADQLRAWSGPVYLYEGLPCLWLCPDPAQPLAATCREARAAGSWVPVASTRITGRLHDNANGRAADGRPVTLYRLARP